MARSLWFLIPILTVGACLVHPTSPSGTLEGLPTGLAIEFGLDRDEVPPHGPFSAILEITNTREDTVRVVTGMGCLVIPRVVRNGESVPFRGSAWGCTAAVTTHVFPPHETRSMSFDMHAELYAVAFGEVDGAPAPAGLYEVQAVFEVSPVAGRKPMVADTLLVWTGAAGSS
jgi:hypothetical protein